MQQSSNVDLTLSNWGSAVSALQQSKWRFLKLQSLSKDAKCCFIFSILPTSGSEPFPDRILSSPSVLPVSNQTRLTNHYKKCSKIFIKLTKNVLKLKNQVKSMRSCIRPKVLQAFCLAFCLSVFRAAQIMHESNCLSADL